MKTCETCYGNKEVIISCCTGDIVDDDIAMCPICYEHLGEETCPDCDGTGETEDSISGSTHIAGVATRGEHIHDILKDSTYD